MSNIIAALRLEILITNRLVKIALLLGWMALIFYLSSIPDLQLTGAWAPLNWVLRKLAHISEYAILAMLWYANVKDAKIAGILSVAYAMTDEIHQYFVPGRTGSGVDVVIDTIGIVIGLFVATWYARRFSKNPQT